MTDLDGLGFDIAQIRHDAHALVELDERDDVGVLDERQRRILRHHEAVHRAAPGRHDVIPVQRLAIAAHRPRRNPQRLAVRAALDAQFVFFEAGPEEVGVRADRGCESAGHQSPAVPAGSPPVLNRSVRNRWRPDDFTVLIAVGRDPGDEVAFAHRRLLLVRDRLENRLAGDLVADAGITLDLELGIRRDDAGVARVG